jgi:hypothetical protein
MGQIEFKRADCPPESGGQRDREADPARGGSQSGTLSDGPNGTTPAPINGWTTPPDSGGELHSLNSAETTTKFQPQLDFGQTEKQVPYRR